MIKLWIAFEIFIFDRLTTTQGRLESDYTSCELLSKFLSLTDWQQRPDVDSGATNRLWIAFEIFIFDRLTTTKVWKYLHVICCELLSKFLSLTDWQQRWNWQSLRKSSCELLSKFLSLTDWQQHPQLRRLLPHMLWIAFEIFIFDRLTTTHRDEGALRCLLWIAFEIFIFDRLTTTGYRGSAGGTCCELLSKFLSLTDWQQHRHKYNKIIPSCELLSKFLSLTDWQQLYRVPYIQKWVVNCFRNFYLWQTDNNWMLVNYWKLKIYK